MTFIENIRLAIAALWTNRMRSFLTMLGIIIGISAVITITTIGNSIQETLSSTFEQFGMNSIIVMLTPKVSDDFEVTDYTISENDKITYDMLDTLLDTYPGQFELSLTESYDEGTVSNYRNETVTVHLNGITAGFLEQSKIDIIQGRNITQRDNKEEKHTVVVSDIFINQFFKSTDKAIGETISFSVTGGETIEFTIVGVYRYSESILGRFDPGTKEIDKVTMAYVPINTVYKLLGESDTKYDYATVIWNTDYEASVVETNLQEYFDKKYALNKNWEIQLENQQNNLDSINGVLNIVTVAISVIAAISLIVGGVGVMNIMLVSIVERTKEIGVRKAIGANNTTIQMQFVTEAIVICLVGGVLGVIFGIVGGLLIGKIAMFVITNYYPDYGDVLSISIKPSVVAIIISIAFSMLTGLFFGYYPAKKAANMNPIDALRYD